MGNFDDAVSVVLANEGGLVDDANDPGGLTNMGISFRFLQSIPLSRLKNYGINYSDESHLVEILKNLTVDQAKAIYRGEFWDQALFRQMNNQHVCNYVFDAAVNLGISVAIKITQRAVNAIKGNLNYISEDGILGNKTLDEVNHAGILLMPPLRSERAGEYRWIAKNNAKAEKSLNGWLGRAYNG